ncbi:hypothetical protein [Xanthomonas albilineans]|uniref:hypothetical protein n=1 Tax=Xanthomonas albilineans TaxID=29447 RepID=UPI0005F30DA2|nr:hypothetical protein [Xanthomonas albilineans]
MNIKELYISGRFATDVAHASCELLGRSVQVLPYRDDDGAGMPVRGSSGADFAVVFSRPDIFALEAIGRHAGNAHWLAVFPFERHIVVTSTFRPGAACASCFVRRWLSLPPDGYPQEVVLAIATMAQRYPDVEYTNLNPLAARMAARFLLRNMQMRDNEVVLIDTAGLDIQSARVRAVHGCACRGTNHSTATTPRFVRFSNEFMNLVRQRSPDMRTRIEVTEREDSGI